MRWKLAMPSVGSRAAWSLGRARLGARSILGDPRNPEMQRTLNLEGQISRELPAVRAFSPA